MCASKLISLSAEPIQYFISLQTIIVETHSAILCAWFVQSPNRSPSPARLLMSNFSIDSLQKELFASFKGKKHKPTRELLAKELTCCGHKGYAKLNLDKLFDKLLDYPFKEIKWKCMNHIESHVDSMTKLSAEKEEEAQGVTN